MLKKKERGRTFFHIEDERAPGIESYLLRDKKSTRKGKDGESPCRGSRGGLRSVFPESPKSTASRKHSKEEGLAEKGGEGVKPSYDGTSVCSAHHERGGPK